MKFAALLFHAEAANKLSLPREPRQIGPSCEGPFLYAVHE